MMNPQNATRAAATFVVAVVTVVTVTLVTPVSVTASISQERTGAPALLDVPYVSQTPELCGGAAVAMVLRYWGERQVFAQDFASLVVASERGIPTGALRSAVQNRQWQAVVVGPEGLETHARIRRSMDQGRPLIALIEVSPRTYHYVVIVGATEQEVVVHDPARAPFRVVPWREFDRAWAAAGEWMMLVLPPADARPSVSPAPVTPPAPNTPGSTALTPCDALVERGVALALSGDRDGAEAGLVAATRMCPMTSGAWLELAGLRFAGAQWAEAATLAATAVRLAPADAHARELLATSRYLSGDAMGALEAWTAGGEPRIDAINVLGAEHTRHPVVVGATGLQPRQVLTSEAFRRALRRVQALPVAAGAHMQYEPLSEGLARVDVSLNEREPFPKGWVTFAILGGRAAVGHGLRFDLAGLSGSGELVSVAGRWQSGRPRVALGFAVPSPYGLPGVFAFDALWERQQYPGQRESRRRMALQVSDWSTSWLRWRGGAAVDRFDARRHVSVSGGLDFRFAGDRVAMVASGATWFPSADTRRFTTRSLLGAWRSSDDAGRSVWSAVAEVSAASDHAPLALWEGAGTGAGRAGLLRAHPLLDAGVLTGTAFGRQLTRGTLEYAHPIGQTLAGAVGVAVFVDAAVAGRRFTAMTRSPFYVDAGVGLRLRVPGRAESVRIDVAHGLRGGGITFSVGLVSAWPY